MHLLFRLTFESHRPRVASGRHLQVVASPHLPLPVTGVLVGRQRGIMLSLWKDLTKMAVCSPWGFMGHPPHLVSQGSDVVGRAGVEATLGGHGAQERPPPWSTLPHLSVPGVHRWGVGQALRP